MNAPALTRRESPEPSLAEILGSFQPLHLAYCDYIAYRIARGLAQPDAETLIADVGRVEWDLHPVGGYMLSTKKTISVTDRNGKAYRVTVEEVTP